MRENNMTTEVNFKEENYKLLTKYKESNSEEVLEQLIKLNEGLVLKNANKYIKRCNSLDFNDIKIIGTMGLIDAIKNYDIKYDASFSSYATSYISGMTLTTIANEDRMIRIPKEKVNKMNKFYFYYDKEKNNYEETCSLIDEDESSIAALINSSNYMSIDFCINDGSDTPNSLYDLIPGESMDDAVEKIILEESARELLDAFQYLNDKEKYVITYRYGFDNDIIKTHKDIAFKYGVTSEAIRQTEHRALKKLFKKIGM